MDLIERNSISGTRSMDSKQSSMFCRISPALAYVNPFTPLGTVAPRIAKASTGAKPRSSACQASAKPAGAFPSSPTTMSRVSQLRYYTLHLVVLSAYYARMTKEGHGGSVGLLLGHPERAFSGLTDGTP